MPQLVNAQTGFAENLDPSEADAALNAGTHEIPLIDPQGNLTSAPLANAHQLLQAGHTQLSDEQRNALTDYAKYNSTPEQIKTFLEGAGSAGTFGLSTGAERLFGVKPEDIQKRREYNPGIHGIGQAAGLAASSFIPGAGEANLLKDAGESGAAALGAGEIIPKALEGGKIVNEFVSNPGVTGALKAGAARGAIESALFTSGDELSREFSGDPDAGIDTAVPGILLSGVLGAPLGAAAEMIPFGAQKLADSKLANYLTAIKQRMRGLDDAQIAKISDLEKQAGIVLAPEVRAAMMGKPIVEQMGSELRESEDWAGNQFREAEKGVSKGVNDIISNTFARTPEQIDNIALKSDSESGRDAISTLTSEIQDRFGPSIEGFKKVQTAAGSEPLPFEYGAYGDLKYSPINDMLQKVSQWSAENVAGPNSDAKHFVDYSLNKIKQAKTIDDLKTIQSQINEAAKVNGQWATARPIRQIIRDAETDALTKVADKMGGDLPQVLAESRAGYREAMQILEPLNDRLRLGEDSYQGILRELKDRGSEFGKAEQVLNRLAPKNDAGMLSLLREQFPKTAEKVKQQFIDDLLFSSKSKTEESGISPKIFFNKLFNNSNAYTPEMRQFIMSPEHEQRLIAAQKIVHSLPEKIGQSGTPRGIDALMKQVPAGIGAAIGLASGHGISGYLLGHLAKLLGRDAPDAAKLALLKFLGSENPTDVPAFRAMFKTITAFQKGQQIINRTTKDLFKSGRIVLPDALMPTEASTQKLEKKLEAYSDNPDQLVNSGGKVPYYLPDHGQSLGALTARAVGYLQQVKPRAQKSGPLDPELKPSDSEEAQYQRTLEIAQQPLTVLHHIANGTLTPRDIVDLKSIYPSLYGKLTEKLYNEMISHVSKGEEVPYAQRQSLSLFLGQALDSTLQPQSIMAVQQSFAMSGPQPQEGQSQGAPVKKRSTAKLGEAASSLRTPAQSREYRQNKA